jgi:RNA-directed DNA polymerase
MLDRGRAPDKQLTLPFAQQRGEASVGAPGESTPVSDERLMERVVERHNLLTALARVKANRGSPGIDGMTVEELPDYLRQHWPEIRAGLLSGSYRPSPVRRVEIPKPGGGVRKLGIPTVLDRLIQQAVLQVLQPEWDKTFSDHSYGFRPGRSAHQAIARAQQYLEDGYDWVVDLDLEKFFGAPGKARRFQRVQFPPRQGASHPTGNRVLDSWRERHELSVDRATRGP